VPALLSVLVQVQAENASGGIKSNFNNNT